MLPFSVDKLIMDMSHDMDIIKHDIINRKHSFCVSFEKELSLQVGDYSQSVFDYVYNLFFFKQAFKKEELKRLVEEFKDMNFLNSANTCQYISKKYLEFIVIYKKHFMDYFGFNHEDPLYMHRKIQANKSDIIQKLLEYY